MTSVNLEAPYFFLIFSLLLALIPMGLTAATCYLKTSIVVAMLKNAIGLQGTSAIAVECALAVTVTFFVMHPVFSQIGARLTTVPVSSWKGMSMVQIQSRVADISEPWRQFLSDHAGQRELALMTALDARGTANSILRASQIPEPIENISSVKSSAPVASLKLILPSFVLSELRQACLMAFMLLLPFLIVDLAVANLLSGLGLSMASPTTISLPIKLILFVVSDGWMLLIDGLIRSY